jgi:glycerol-3-phosphate dehydrogenase
MQKIQQRISLPKRLDRKNKILHENIEIDKYEYSNDLIHRWQGRFGERLPEFLASIQQDEQTIVPETQTSWAEIRWAARNERIVHLDDLLLRRVRLGLLLPKGGMQHEERIRKIVIEECGWNEEKWIAESERYREIISRYYSKST